MEFESVDKPVDCVDNSVDKSNFTLWGIAQVERTESDRYIALGKTLNRSWADLMGFRRMDKNPVFEGKMVGIYPWFWLLA